MLAVGWFPCFLPLRRPRSGVWKRPSSLHWWSPQVRGCCLTCTDTRGREGGLGDPGDLAGQPLTQGTGVSSRHSPHKFPCGCGRALTGHDAVPSCPRRRWWGPGRPCPGRRAAEGPPFIGFAGGVPIHVGTARDGAPQAPGETQDGSSSTCRNEPARGTDAAVQTSTWLDNVEGNVRKTLQFYLSVLAALW